MTTLQTLPPTIIAQILHHYTAEKLSTQTTDTPPAVSFTLNPTNATLPRHTTHLHTLHAHYPLLASTRALRTSTLHHLSHTFTLHLPDYTYLAALRDDASSYRATHAPLLAQTQHIRITQGSINIWKWSSYLTLLRRQLPSLQSVQVVYSAAEAAREDVRADAPRWWVNYIEAFVLVFSGSGVCEVRGRVGAALGLLVEEMNANRRGLVVVHGRCGFYGEEMRRVVEELREQRVEKPEMRVLRGRVAGCVVFKGGSGGDGVEVKGEHGHGTAKVKKEHGEGDGEGQRLRNLREMQTPRPIQSLDEAGREEWEQTWWADDPFRLVRKH